MDVKDVVCPQCGSKEILTHEGTDLYCRTCETLILEFWSNWIGWQIESLLKFTPKSEIGMDQKLVCGPPDQDGMTFACFNQAFNDRIKKRFRVLRSVK